MTSSHEPDWTLYELGPSCVSITMQQICVSSQSIGQVKFVPAIFNLFNISSILESYQRHLELPLVRRRLPRDLNFGS